MKRNHWQHVMAGLIFLAANLQTWAGAELNLLGNPDLAKDAQGQIVSWNVSPTEAWTRAAIESFKGLPFTVNYMRFEGKKGELVQSGVAVETNTWYVLRAWFKADLKNNGYVRFYALPDKADPAARRYNQVNKYNEDVCDVEDVTLAPFGGVKLGSVSDWVEIRAYAFSGVSTQLALRAEVQGPGECFLGNPEVIKLPDDEFLNPRMADGNFCKGMVGREPVMFSAKPELKVPARIVKYDGMTQDSPNCLRIDRKTPAAAYVYGPQSILVRPGETLEVSLWAKTSWGREELKAPPILTVFSLRQGKWWRSAQAVMLTRNWERVTYRVTIPEQGGSYIPGPQLLDVHLQATGGVEDVNISDFKLRILPVGQSGAPAAEEYWWKPRGRNQVMNGSFEAGMKGWCAWFYTWDVDSASKSLGEITIDETAAAQGRCSLKVAIPDYPAGSPTTHVISASFKVPAREILANVQSACFEVDPKMHYTVSFWARTDVPGNATVSAGGQSFVLTNQWTRYSATFKPDKPSANLLYPSFRFQGTGSHYLDGVMIETGKVVSSFEPAEPADVGGRFLRRYPLFARGEKPEARLFINNSGKEKTSYRLERTIRDWQGRQVMKNEQDVNLDANETKVETVPLFDQAYGVFSARFELLEAATRQRINWFEMNYGVLPEQDGKLTAAESPVGVIPFLVHFWPGYNVPGGSLDDFNDVLQRIGCRWIGIYSAGWRTVERKPGDWVWSDAYMQSFKKHGFEMYAILGGKIRGVPEWAASDEPLLIGGKQDEYRGFKIFYPKMEAWNEYVRQFVGHYKGMIGYYEVLGETGGATPDWFMRINKATQPIIREVDPGAKMLGPCYPSHALPWGDDDDSWVGQVFRKGIYDYVDIVTAHFYPPSERASKALEESISSKGTVEQMLAQRIGYLRSKYGDKPLWNTEYGLFNVSKYPWFYSQHTKAKLRGFREGDLYSTDRKHAERWVRWNVMLLAAGVERSMQHTFGHAGLNIQSYQAMLHPDYSPKMAIGSCAQMCRRLVAPKLRKQKAVERTRVLLFDTRNGPVILFWDFGLEDKVGRLEVSGIAPRDMDLEDLMGNPLEPETASGDMLRLPLSPAPAYLVPKKAEDAERLFEALSCGKRVVLEGGKDVK